MKIEIPLNVAEAEGLGFLRQELARAEEAVQRVHERLAEAANSILEQRGQAGTVEGANFSVEPPVLVVTAPDPPATEEPAAPAAKE